MKKLIFSILGALVVASASFAGVAQAAENQGVNYRRVLDTNTNLTFSKFAANYVLQADEKGNTTLEVTETLEANFEQDNINRGIERAIPNEFDGRKIFDGNIEAFRNGESERVSANRNGEYTIFRIGNSKKYVQGKQTYTIKYKLHNVLRTTDGEQSLYLNVNGTQWHQSFGEVVAAVKMSEEIQQKLNSKYSCYSGAAGESKNCDISAESNGDFIFRAKNVGVGENMTFAIGFKANSFAQPDKMLDLTVVANTILAIIFVAFSVVAGMKIREYIKKIRENNPAQPTPPQYLPPKMSEIDIIEAAQLVPSTNKMTAVILFLAVNQNLRVVEKEKKTAFGRTKKVYELKKLNNKGLNSNLAAVLDKLFSGGKTTLDLSKKLSESQSTALYNMVQNRDITSTRFYDKINRKTKLNRIMTGVLVFWIALLFVGAPILRDLGIFDASVVLMIVLNFIPLVVFFIVAYLPILSKDGYEMRNYFEGLKIFIKTAEKDRLAFAQSLENSERFKTEFGGSRIKLFEKLLPWAALFGLEKTWAKVLELEMAETDYSPDWYYGVSAFNYATFANSISSVSSAINSYSAPVSSSGSGTGGGGFSGGGAGGGGGGGW